MLFICLDDVCFGDHCLATVSLLMSSRSHVVWSLKILLPELIEGVTKNIIYIYIYIYICLGTFKVFMDHLFVYYRCACVHARARVCVYVCEDTGIWI